MANCIVLLICPKGTCSISNLPHKTDKKNFKFSLKVHYAPRRHAQKQGEIRGKFTCLIPQVLDRFRSRVKSSKYFPSSLSHQTFREDLRVDFVLSKRVDARNFRGASPFSQPTGDHGVMIFLLRGICIVSIRRVLRKV